MGNRPLIRYFFTLQNVFSVLYIWSRDFYTENALDGYIVTVKAARNPYPSYLCTREWGNIKSIGPSPVPMGQGNQHSHLFAAKLLGDPGAITTQQALDMLRRGDTSLYERFISANGNGKNPSSGFLPSADLW